MFLGQLQPVRDVFNHAFTIENNLFADNSAPTGGAIAIEFTTSGANLGSGRGHDIQTSAERDHLQSSFQEEPFLNLYAWWRFACSCPSMSFIIISIFDLILEIIPPDIF